MAAPGQSWIEIDARDEIWSRVFTVAPLVVVGTVEQNGSQDFAPKHMAIPLGPGRHFAFVCTPRHNTYGNAKRTGCFTVTYLKPDQIVQGSLAASPRTAERDKPALAALPRIPAEKIEGAVLADGLLALECQLDRIVDGFDGYSLIIGRIVHARADAGGYRSIDVDDAESVGEHPLLAYVHPGRWARIVRTDAFPFPWGFER